jgi:hypothetical protein
VEVKGRLQMLSSKSARLQQTEYDLRRYAPLAILGDRSRLYVVRTVQTGLEMPTYLVGATDDDETGKTT